MRYDVTALAIEDYQGNNSCDNQSHYEGERIMIRERMSKTDRVLVVSLIVIMIITSIIYIVLKG